jgi:hypothetical protein
MGRRSLRDLLRRKRAERRHMSLEMRSLMESFEAQYEQPKPRGKDSSDTTSSARPSQDSQ